VPSAMLLAWRLMENKLATKVNLSRRGVLVDIRCVVCVGRRKKLADICSSTATLPGKFGVYVIDGLGF